jgi:hypothetical protein
MAFPDEARVHRIARGARNWTHDHALLAQQAVHQGALARVGTPQDGDLDAVVLDDGVAALGQHAPQTLDEAVHAVAGGGRDGMRLPHSELEQRRTVLAVLGTLGLVGQQERGFPAALHVARELEIVVGDAGAGVHHEQDDRGVVHRDVDLPLDLLGQGVYGFVDEAAGVDDVDETTFELPFAEMAVTSDTGPVVDNRRAPTEDSVEQAGLPDIGPADDHDTGSLGHRMKGSSWRRAPLAVAAPRG